MKFLMVEPSSLPIRISLRPKYSPQDVLLPTNFYYHQLLQRFCFQSKLPTYIKFFPISPSLSCPPLPKFPFYPIFDSSSNKQRKVLQNNSRHSASKKALNIKQDFYSAGYVHIHSV